MNLSLDILNFQAAQQSDRAELYQSLTRNICDLRKKDNPTIDEKDVEILFCEISKDLGSENQALIECLLEQLEELLKEDETCKQPFLSEDQKRSVIKSIINLIKVPLEEKIQLLCFSHLDALITVIKLADDMLENLLGRISETMSNKTISVSLYVAACSYVQKFCKEYAGKLSNFMHILPKLIFLPLSHNAGKVRGVAEVTLDSFPKLLLYAEDGVVSSVMLKLVKEPYCKELLMLFKIQQEQYVLKVWKHIVNALGKDLHRNLPIMTPFFQIIERGFKSSSDDVCKAAFLTWKSLISNFALDEVVLNDSKKLRFVLKPFKNISKFNENISLAVCDTWWHLAWNLSHNLSSRFTEVCIPLLEFTLGKAPTGSHEKAPPKGTQIFLAKRGCHFLLRLLEQPPNSTFNRISSPKKLPPILFPALQVPLDVKVIVRHSKEIMSMVRTVIEVFGSVKDMTIHLDCTLKSVFFVVSTVIEDRNKESVEAVISLINLVSDITESRMCPPLTCLKCIDSLSKLPRSTLVSHCFNCGPRKPQDILCTTLLKLLMNPYLFVSETSNKRFLLAYNRLIQAGLCESLNPLLMAQKYINIVKAAVPEGIDSELLFEIWSGIASPLLEAIEKTQEVNQGDKQDHDFSCLYDVLLCPFEHILPVSMHQLRTKPALKLWTNLYKTFIRCSSLVNSALPNEACGHFCARLKSHFKDNLLKEPQYFEAVCFLLEIVIDSVDFTSFGATNSQGLSNASLFTKKKKPLGNLNSLVDMLTVLLNSFYLNYIDAEEIYQSCTPKAQRKSHISKTGIPLDLVKTFFGNLKSGSTIPFVLGELAHPLSKLFSTNQKKYTNIIGTKLEILWNVVTSSIEMHYLGPYDSDFLTMMNPLLEPCISHPRRHIKERSRRFWFATFAPASSSLKIPESLKVILKKSKLSLMPEENISSLEEFSYTAGSGSLEDGAISFERAVELKDPFLKPFEVIGIKESKPVEKKADVKPLKQNTPNSKKSVDELPIDEFVKIDSPGPSSLTPRRRSVRQRKSFVPALYNDLSQSQDTTTMGGSSESFDTSSSCEIIEFKSQEEFAKSSTLAEKEVDLIDEKKFDVVTISSENDTEPQDNLSVEVIEDAKEIISHSEKLLILSEVEPNDPTRSESEKAKSNNLNSLQELDTKEKQISSKNEKEVDLSVDKVNNVLQLEESNIIPKNLKKISILKDSFEEIAQVAMLESVPVPSQVGLKKTQRLRLKKKCVNENQSDKILKGRKKEALTDITKIIDPDEGSVKTISKLPKTPEIAMGKRKIINSLNDDSITHKKVEFPGENTVTPKSKFFEATAKKSLNVCHKKNYSESFSGESIKNEIIEISDSEEIIPSSQSSDESVSYKKLPAIETVSKQKVGPRRSLTFDTLSEKLKTPDAPILIAVISTETTDLEKISCVNIEEPDDAECPETPLDLMGPSAKDPFDVVKQESKLSSSCMPLKSSENLLSSDEHDDKTDNKDAKSIISTFILNNENKKLNVAENSRPICDEVCVLHTTEHVCLQDKIILDTEEKLKSVSNLVESKLAKTELKLSSSIENPCNEDSPKTTRVKSLRSAGSSSVRKSLDGITKTKVIKKSYKRKSMPSIIETKGSKYSTLDVFMDTNEVLADSDDLIPSTDSSTESSSVNSEMEKETKMVVKRANKRKSMPGIRTKMSKCGTAKVFINTKEVLPDSDDLVPLNDISTEPSGDNLELGKKPKIVVKKSYKRKSMSDIIETKDSKYSTLDVFMDTNEVLADSDDLIPSTDSSTESSSVNSEMEKETKMVVKRANKRKSMPGIRTKMSKCGTAKVFINTKEVLPDSDDLVPLNDISTEPSGDNLELGKKPKIVVKKSYKRKSMPDIIETKDSKYSTLDVFMDTNEVLADSDDLIPSTDSSTESSSVNSELEKEPKIVVKRAYKQKSMPSIETKKSKCGTLDVFIDTNEVLPDSDDSVPLNNISAEPSGDNLELEKESKVFVKRLYIPKSMPGITEAKETKCTLDVFKNTNEDLLDCDALVRSNESKAKSSNLNSELEKEPKIVVKRTYKRKGIPGIIETKKTKCDTVKVSMETNEVLPDSDDLAPSNDISAKSLGEKPELERESQIEIFASPKPSRNIDFEKEDDSFLEEISSVISGIHEKLELYDSNCTPDFSLNEGRTDELPLHENDGSPLGLNEESQSDKKENNEYTSERLEIKHADDTPADYTEVLNAHIESSITADSEKQHSSVKYVETEVGAVANSDARQNDITSQPNKSSKTESHIHSNLITTVDSESSKVNQSIEIEKSVQNPIKDQNVTLDLNIDLNISKEEEIGRSLLYKKKYDSDSKIESVGIEKDVSIKKSSAATIDTTLESTKCCEIIDDEVQHKLQTVSQDRPVIIMIEKSKSLSNFQASENLSQNMLDGFKSSPDELLREKAPLSDTSNHLNFIKNHKEVQLDTAEITKEEKKPKPQKMEDQKEPLALPIESINFNFVECGSESSDNKQVHYANEVADYEKMNESCGVVAAYQEEATSENVKFAESVEHITENSLVLQDAHYIENEMEEINLNNGDAIKNNVNDPSVELKSENSNENASQEIKAEFEKCVYDLTNDLLSAVSSESNYSETLKLPVGSFNPTTQDAKLSTLNGSDFYDTEVLDTPDLLASETFKTNVNGKPDELDSFKMSSTSNKVASVQNNINEDAVDKAENSSRKRKGKRPVRSPFHFRQRSNVIVSMAKNVSKDHEHNSLEVMGVKRTIENVCKKSSENGEKRLKIVVVDSKSHANKPSSESKVTHVCNNKPAASSSDMKKSFDTAKSSKVEVNYNEMTNVNTRYNASVTNQTRRFKMIAASHKSDPPEDNCSPPPGEKDLYSEEITILNSILKKRQTPSGFSSAKLKRVTFADPLVEERLFTSDDNDKRNSRNDILVITKDELNKNSSQVSEKVAKVNSTLSLATDEIPSSNEYQSSDTLTDYSNLPVSPLLINCEENVSVILKDLTSPTWVRGLETLLLSKNIKTIGDLCKLNIHELKALPFKSPKVVCLHKALLAHLKSTQRATLEKLKAVDDWCSNLVSSEGKASESKVDSNSGNEGEKVVENIESELAESLTSELLSNEMIKKLPTQTLILLAKRCFDEVTQRLENS